MKYSIISILRNLLLGYFIISNGYSQTISKNEMILGLSKAWKEVTDNYIHYSKIPFDWDSLYISNMNKILSSDNLTDIEYANLLQHFFCSLHDGHTYINYLEKSKKKYNFQTICKYENGKIYVIGNSTGNAKSLPIGTEIISINNLNILEYLDSFFNEFSIRKDIRYEILSEIFLLNNNDSVLNVDCMYPDKSSFHNIVIKAQNKNDRWNLYLHFHPDKNEITYIQDSILYVKIKDFSNPELFNEFINSIDLLKKSKGLIFDIRHNKGGSDFGYLIYKYFTYDSLYNFIYKKRINDSYMRSLGAYANNEVMSFLGRTKNHKYYNYYKSKFSWFDNSITEIDTVQQKIGFVDYVYNKPIVILTDERTASASEYFIVGLKSITYPIVIGSQTFGSLSRPLFIPICKNIIGQVSAFSVICNNKECIFIEPDISLKPSISDFINHNDIVLKKGIEVVNSVANK